MSFFFLKELKDQRKNVYFLVFESATSPPVSGQTPHKHSIPRHNCFSHKCDLQAENHEAFQESHTNKQTKQSKQKI